MDLMEILCRFDCGFAESIPLLEYKIEISSVRPVHIMVITVLGLLEYARFTPHSKLIIMFFYTETSFEVLL